jgi:hypothetical protein
MRRTFNLARIETARETLDALPSAGNDMREVGMRETVKMLAPTIRKLVAKGYPLAKVVELLAEQGVTIGLAALKEHYREKTGRAGEGKRGSGAHAGDGKARGEQGPNARHGGDQAGGTARPPVVISKGNGGTGNGTKAAGP